MEPFEGLEIAPAVDWDSGKIEELFAALHGRTGKPFQVAEAIVLDEAKLDDLVALLAPRLLAIPSVVEHLRRVDQNDQVRVLFPDFPEAFNSDRYDQRIRNVWKAWYEGQGFEPRTASTLAGNHHRINPVRLLTISKAEFLGIRNLGESAWREVLAWREKNKDKLPREEGG